MRRTWKTKAAILSATAMAGISTTARAAQRNWAAGVTGDIGATSSWQGGLVPGSGDQANISNGVATVVTGDAYTFSELWAGFQNPGTVQQSGGTITSNWVVLGRGVSGSSTGFYNISGGTLTQTGSGGSELQLAGIAGTGAGQGVNATVLTISGSAIVNNGGNFDIGDNAATVNQTGGTVNATGQLWIGQSGTGVYNLSGGVINSSNWAVVARGNGTGVFNLNGGTFIHSATSSGDFEIGSGGTSATLNLNSGLLVTNYFRDENAAGKTAIINFNGATVQANNSDAGYIGGHMSNSDVYTMNVLDGGAIFNTSSFNIGITATQPLIHGSATVAATDGGLTKYGSGALTLYASNSYTGPTTVNQGTLNIIGSVPTATAVNSGAIIGSYNASGGGGSIGGGLTFTGPTTLLANPTGTQFLTVTGVTDGTAGNVLVVPTLTTAPTSGVEVLYAKGGLNGTIGAPGSGANFTPGIRGTLTTVADASTVGTDLILTATTTGPGNLVWKGTDATNPSYWNVEGTTNFLNTGTSAPDLFYAGDNVTFDDSGTTTNVVLQGSYPITPTTVNFSNTAAGNSYTLSGNGIAGSGSLAVTGGGTVTLKQINTYTGTTNISNGTLVVGTGGSLSSSTTINLGSGASNGVLVLGDATGPVATTAAGLIVTGTGSGNTVIGGNATASTLTVTTPIYAGTPTNLTSALTIGAGASLIGNSTSNPSIGIGSAVGQTGTVNVLPGATLTSNSNDIWVGNGSGGVGTLNISGGTVLVGGWIAPGRAGGTGTINMTGGSLIKTGSGNLDIAGDGAGSRGYFYQTGGLVTTSTFVVLGENNVNEIGVWNLSGGSTTANVASLIAGSSGNGTVNLFNGGQMTSQGTTIIAQNGSAVGALNISGGASMTSLGLTTVAGANGSVGNLIVTGGTDTTNGLNVLYNGTVSVAGAGVVPGILNIVNGAGSTIIGQGATTTTGTLNVATGGTFNGGNAQIWAGNGSTGVGVINVSGGVLNVSNYLAPGRVGGTGTIYLSSGGINVLETDIVTDPVTGFNTINLGLGQTVIGGGLATGGRGFFYQTGGTFNSPNAAVVLGETAGSTTALQNAGTWNISGGSATLVPAVNPYTAPNNFFNSLTIGSGGNGTVNVSGTGQLAAGNVVIASAGGTSTSLPSNGALNVSGGSVTARSIDIGLGGNGVVNVTSGGHLSSASVTLASNPISLTQTTNATGILNISGGTLTTTAITAGISGINPTISINGGILQAGNSTTTLISLPASIPVQIGSSGATIDTQAFNVGVPAVLAGSSAGGLTKTGTGNLRLSASNSYAGGTTVNAGTLTVANANALSTGTVALANNATLALALNPSAIQFTGYNLNQQTPVFAPIVSASQTAVTLTTTTGNEATSIFDGNNFVSIDDTTGFAASFTYNHGVTGPNQTSGEGVIFVLQNGNASPSVAGGAAGSIAYNGGPGFGSSLAAGVDSFNDRLVTGAGNGSNGAFTVVQTDGTSPIIGLTSSANVTIVYTPGPGGTPGTLVETFTSLSNGSSTSITSTGIDAAALLGGSAGGATNAYVGFTSSSGLATDVQTISDFKFNTAGTSLPTDGGSGAVAITNTVTVADGASSTLQLAPTSIFSSGTVGPILVGNSSTLSISIGANASAGVTKGVLTAPSIAFSNSTSGTLNVGKNALDLTGPSGSPLTLGSVSGMVATAFKNGAWNGPGISSSAAASDATHLTALGVIVNSVDGTSTGAALYGSSTALGTFEGISPASTDILVKYTYYGDANLDGKVDGSDYNRIDSNFVLGGHLSGWYNGDFNYDGVINGSDYTLIDNAFNTQGTSLAAEFASPLAVATAQISGGSAGSSAVPEPTTLSLLAIGAAGLLGRRRRHNSTRLAGAL